MNIKQQTNNVASQGRYGDTMLMHVNPAEVQGLASIMPLTQNPQTGQPEAFLPFLAPLLGSALGTAGLTGAGAGALGGLIGATGLSSAAAGAIGSGLTTALIEGDLKKGIMSGITGFGLGKVMGAAGLGGTEAVADEASKAAITEAAGSNAVTAATLGETAGQAVTDAATSNFSGDAIGSLVESSGLNATNLQEALGSGLTSQADLVAQASAANPNFIAPGMEGFRDRLGAIGKGAFSGDTMSALTNPSGYLPIALGEGQKGVMESQENFERQMAQMELDRKNAREKMYADNPENIPMSSRYYGASGGIMSLAEGGKTLPKAPKDKIPDELRFPPPLPRLPPRPIVDNSFEAAMSGSQDYRYKPKQSRQPVREAYQKMQVNELTGEEMPTGQYVPPSNYKAGVDAEFNYFPNSNKPATYLGNYLDGTGYNYSDIISGLSDLSGLDNLQGITLPSGLGFNYNNQIGQPTGNDYPAEYIASLIGPGNNINSPITNMPMDRPDTTMPIERPDTTYRPFPIDRPISTPPIMSQPMPVAPPEMQQPMPPQIIPSMPNETSVPFVPPVSMPQPVSGIDERDFMDSIGITPPNVPQPIMQQPMPVATPVQQPIPQLAPEVLQQLPPEVIQQLMPTPSPVMMPAPSVNMGLPQTRIAGRPSRARGRAEGGDTLKDIPADNKGLPNLPSSVRNEMGYKQAGGETEVDPLITEVTAFILGESENNEALNAFIQKYGNEAFMQLRQQILQSLVPNAQTEGQIQGDGNGGMDDDLFGRIGNKERIAVSQDEFIVPADVVSMLGDGSSDAGSKELYDMMDRVRNEKTGTTKQAPRLANAGGMLPA